MHYEGKVLYYIIDTTMKISLTKKGCVMNTLIRLLTLALLLLGTISFAQDADTVGIVIID